jgi:hypothetical protein
VTSPKAQWFKSECCAHTAAAGIRRAGWWEWRRQWRKSGYDYSDVCGVQPHSGLSNGCRASHLQPELLLDLCQKGVYSSSAPYDGLCAQWAVHLTVIMDGSGIITGIIYRYVRRAPSAYKDRSAAIQPGDQYAVNGEWLHADHQIDLIKLIK